MIGIYKIFIKILYPEYFTTYAVFYEKTTPFWILSDKLGCSFFFMNIEKLHLNSSLKITLKFTFFPFLFQKTTPQFVTQNHAKTHIFMFGAFPYPGL